jgi:hypothetical protein
MRELFLILFLLLFGCGELDMATLFCCPYNSDLDSCQGDTPVTVSPATVGIDTSIKKFGAGSAKSNDIGVIQSMYLEYDTLTGGYPDNSGAISWWMYATAGILNRQIIRFPGSNSRILLTIWFRQSSGDKLEIDLQMYDDAGVNRVNATLGPVAFTYTTKWYHFELDWLWNDASGKTELFIDGVSKISDTGGNSYNFDGSQLFVFDVDISNDDDAYPLYLDDMTVTNARLNTIGFTPPSSPNCVCPGGAVARRIGWGSQLSSFSQGFSSH